MSSNNGNHSGEAAKDGQEEVFTKNQRAVLGAAVGYAIGSAFGEVAHLVDDELVHAQYDLPPIVTGFIGAVVLGTALYRAKSREN